MNKKTLFALWGGLFLLCAGLGFIPEADGLLKALMVIFSVAFFVPPFVLLRRSERSGDRDTIQLIRNLSAMSLIATVALLIINFLSVLGSETLGNILYYVLVIVSSPMVCGQYWVVSLFLWACLMITAATMLKKK